MRFFLVIVLAIIMTSCSDPKVPTKWAELKITNEGFEKVEKETDQNGYYVIYSGISRDQLLKNVSQSLFAAGYKEVGTAFGGSVLGYAKDQDRLAVKIDQLDGKLYLAIFNENGKEPLLHGTVFGKYVATPVASKDEAKKALQKDLESKN
jgi:hypothetical protein